MSPHMPHLLARAFRALYAISHVHTGTPLFKILDPPLICVRNPMHRHFGVSRPIFQDPPGTKIFAGPKLPKCERPSPIVTNLPATNFEKVPVQVVDMSGIVGSQRLG